MTTKLNLLLKRCYMQNIILHEDHPRGFFSNLTTVLTCTRYLTNQGHDIQNIYLSPHMFTLYGHPANWFSPECISDQGDMFNSLEGNDLSAHSNPEQLDLSSYLSRFSWNTRVKQYLESRVNIPPRTLGLHFRGTDHNINDTTHGSRVDLNVYLDKLHQLWSTGQFSTVFLCSDESAVLDKITNFLIHACNINNIIINPVTRISGRAGLHWGIHNFKTVKLADEVILDAYCLSRCNDVIGKTSNLINFARILTPDLRVHYTDL